VSFFPILVGRCFSPLIMDECLMLHSKHGHRKSQKVASAAIARCDVNKVEKGNNNHKV
jgi:hypothetical protein